MRRYLIIVLPVVWATAALYPLQARTRPESRIIYSNSFEAPEDTSGWIGLYPEMFVEDPAPAQGARSLLIGGGCIQPMAWIDIPCTTGVATFHLSFWGKAGLVTPYGGGIVLSPADWYAPLSEKIEIGTDSLDWAFYHAEKEIHLDAIDTLRIRIIVGGIKYDDMQIDGLEVTVLSTLGTPEDTKTPATFSLEPAYPNPFNPSTTIRYILPDAQHVALRIYDLMGHEVATLVEGHQPAGEYEQLFEARDLPSGKYFARLVAGRYGQTIKLLLLK
jgi:hypothetical protein